jgi:hypothetical protein
VGGETQTSSAGLNQVSCMEGYLHEPKNLVNIQFLAY